MKINTKKKKEEQEQEQEEQEDLNNDSDNKLMRLITQIGENMISLDIGG